MELNSDKRFVVFALNKEDQCFTLITECETFRAAEAEAQHFKLKNKEAAASADLYCFDQQAQKGQFCSWNFNQVPQVETLTRRPNEDAPHYFAAWYDDLLSKLAA